MILFEQSPDGSIDLARHPTLTSFPLRKVSGILFLTETPRLRSLPQNLTVGALSLKRSKIQVLPDGLSVEVWLDLTSSKVRILPQTLVVKGDLYIGGTEIRQITPGAKISGWVDRVLV